MISADALADPGLLALLIAIPIGCVLTALGREGAVRALALAFFGLIPIFVSWHVGSFLRERAQTRRGQERACVSG